MSQDRYAGQTWPFHGDDEIEAAVGVLRSGKTNYWTGTVARSFESAFAEFCGVQHAVFCANGTAALELAIQSLQLPAGSEVVTTPRTYVATASAILMSGHKPVFADIDPISGNITPESVRAVVTPRTAAVLVVHSAGWPADMHGFQKLCDETGLALMEDCAQAHGASIGNQPVGSFSDVAAWSFCQDKIITTGGEGGMITTNRRDVHRFAWSLKDHGKSWEKVFETEHGPGFRWLHDSLGTNVRGTEVQAAIGLLQLGKLPRWNSERRENARYLAGLLQDLPGITCPLPTSEFSHAFYRLNARYKISGGGTAKSRDDILQFAQSQGVPVFTGSCSEIYLEEVFNLTSTRPAQRLPRAREWTDESLAFLVHPGLSRHDLDVVASTMAEAVHVA